MTTTTKNWLTTLSASLTTGAVLYLMGYLTPDHIAALTTWDAWRPVLIAALVAGAWSAYHAYQPQSGKSSSGGSSGNGGSPSQDVTPKEGTIMRRIALATVLLLIGCQNGQLNPQVVQVSTASIQLLACGMGVYVKDTATTPIDWAKVAVDLATNCGMDVENIVALFGADSPVGKAAVANSAKVHSAFLATKEPK